MVRYVASLVLVLSACSADTGPGVDVLKQVLDRRLMSLRPTGFTERNVLFESVRAGAPNGGYYPFKVSLVVRDYGPGYPANRYYGQTCVGKMDQWVFNLHRDSFGEWQVQGRMTVTDGRECKENPAAGVSSIPLSSLSGTPAPSGAIKAASAAPARDSSAVLPTGEWGCYGTGGRVLFSFYLQPDGTYLDGDRRKSGTYRYNASAGNVVFQSGMLDGQTGRNAKGRSFALSNTVNCEASL